MRKLGIRQLKYFPTATNLTVLRLGNRFKCGIRLLLINTSEMEREVISVECKLYDK